MDVFCVGRIADSPNLIEILVNSEKVKGIRGKLYNENGQTEELMI